MTGSTVEPKSIRTRKQAGAGSEDPLAKKDKQQEKQPDPTDSPLFVGSAAKTFRVLHAFDGPIRHMTLADIAKAAQLDRSATQRIVYTLETLGYLRRIAETKTYGLTPKLLQFSFNYVRANELIDKALPYLQDINRTVGETTNLQELDGHEIVFVARFLSRHLVNMDIAVGSRLPAFCTSSGTAILSRLPEDECDAILTAVERVAITPYTEVHLGKLRRRIQQAAEKGYAIIANETVMGDISVAAPILDHRGRPVAAINISVPTSRWTPDKVESELAKHVQVAATSVSKSKFTEYGR
ncbi:IclR family transcriptional regulator [Cupriavidus basilensis]|uniref:IclR family transcriptional regulator n=1 Tax=Cupriavidus basilensis TaxID=68895 RepID=UPI0039F6E82F